jgi:hypothetical protein
VSRSTAPHARPQGAVYGFSVVSPIALRYAREGGGDPLTIDETEEPIERPSSDPIVQWLPRQWNPRHTKVFAGETAFTIWSDDTPTFRVDPTRSSIAVKRPFDWQTGEARVWGLPAALCFMHRGDLAIHGAMVDVHGRGIMLAAPGGFGKTTLAAAFLREGYRVLAEDTVCVRPHDPPLVLPGPACLRLRPDAYRHVELPGTSVVAEIPDRVHLVMDGPLKGTGAPIPLSAVVFLRRGSDGITMARASKTDSLRDLWALTLTLPRDVERKRSFGGAATLADTVPAWNLERQLRWDNLADVVEAIVRTCANA